VNETVVVVTGAEPLRQRALAALPEHPIVLAADGGLDHALAAGLHPAGLVGDLDSVSAEGLHWAQEHATISRHATDKDQTDTELALELAVGLHPARLVLLSGGGDRLDHTLAAIGALGHPSLTSIPLIDAWWGDQRIRVVHGPGISHVDDVTVGSTISLLAMHGRCTGVGITGVRWELTDAELAPMIGRGVSNVATDHAVDITVSSGILSVFLGTPDDTDVARRTLMAEENQ